MNHIKTGVLLMAAIAAGQGRANEGNPAGRPTDRTIHAQPSWILANDGDV